MHDLDRTTLELNSESWETGEFGFEQELPGGTFEVFSEGELDELAMELLSVQSEDELEQFIGKLFKKAGRAIGKVVKSPIGRAIGGALKGAAKAALPAIGGALGSFIPIPGVGTALGTAVGSAVSKALEMEGVQGEDSEYEAAKKLVQVAGSAIQQAASAPPNAPPQQVASRALQTAVQQVTGSSLGGGSSQSSAASRGGGSGAGVAGGRSGRWFRRGRKIVLMGV